MVHAVHGLAGVSYKSAASHTAPDHPQLLAGPMQSVVSAMGQPGQHPRHEDRERMAARRNCEHVGALGHELNRRFTSPGFSQPYSEDGQRLLEALIHSAPLCVGCSAEQLGTHKNGCIEGYLPVDLIRDGCYVSLLRVGGATRATW